MMTAPVGLIWNVGGMSNRDTGHRLHPHPGQHIVSSYRAPTPEKAEVKFWGQSNGKAHEQVLKSFHIAFPRLARE